MKNDLANTQTYIPSHIHFLEYVDFVMKQGKVTFLFTWLKKMNLAYSSFHGFSRPKPFLFLNFIFYGTDIICSVHSTPSLIE